MIDQKKSEYSFGPKLKPFGFLIGVIALIWVAIAPLLYLLLADGTSFRLILILLLSLTVLSLYISFAIPNTTRIYIRDGVIFYRRIMLFWWPIEIPVSNLVGINFTLEAFVPKLLVNAFSFEYKKINTRPWGENFWRQAPTILRPDLFKDENNLGRYKAAPGWTYEDVIVFYNALIKINPEIRFDERFTPAIGDPYDPIVANRVIKDIRSAEQEEGLAFGILILFVFIIILALGSGSPIAWIGMFIDEWRIFLQDLQSILSL